MGHEISTRPPSSQKRIGLKLPGMLRTETVETGRYCLIDWGSRYRRARPKGEGLVPGIVATEVLQATGQKCPCVSRSASTCLYIGVTRLEAAI